MPRLPAQTAIQVELAVALLRAQVDFALEPG